MLGFSLNKKKLKDIQKAMNVDWIIKEYTSYLYMLQLLISKADYF